MANITPTTAAVYIAQKWTREILKPFYNELYFKDFVTRRDDLVANGGNLIHIPFLSTYNARDKVAGTAVTYDANTETEITLTINKHKYLAFLLEDITKKQVNYAVEQAYRGAQAEAIARAMDTDLGALHPSAGTNVAGGATVDDADMIAVVSALDAANVPQGNRVGIMKSSVLQDLRAVNKYTAYDQTGKAGVSVTGNSMISHVYGFDLYVSNNVAVTAGTPNLSHNLFFHKSAISLAVQIPPTYKTEDSADFIGTKMVLHTVYGLTVERSAALVDLERNEA